MNRSAIIQLIFALVLSVVAGGLIFLWMAGQANRRAETAQPETIDVVVASTEIPKGERLTAENIRTAPFLRESLPTGISSDAEHIIGRIALTPLSEGEPITQSRLVSKDVQTGGVSALIAPGMRAVGVKGNKVLGLSGFVRPGNRVDVLVTIDDTSTKEDMTKTKTVLENIRVLATGTEFEAGSADDEPSSVDTYTLELSPEEAERLALAATRGTLHFALRNPADTESIRTGGTDIPRTLAALKSHTKKAAAQQRPRVEIITGTQRQTQRF